MIEFHNCRHRQKKIFTNTFIKKMNFYSQFFLLLTLYLVKNFLTKKIYIIKEKSKHFYLFIRSRLSYKKGRQTPIRPLPFHYLRFFYSPVLVRLSLISLVHLHLFSLSCSVAFHARRSFFFPPLNLDDPLLDSRRESPRDERSTRG